MGRRQTPPYVTGTRKDSVELILTENIDALGQQGEIIRVKPGYARNYLIPQGLATIATEENKRAIERHRQRQLESQAARMKQVRDIADKISGYSATIEANANNEGQLYGSVTEVEISRNFQQSGFSVEPEQVLLEGPLKELGMYTVTIQLHPEVTAETKVWVVPTGEG